MGKSNKLLRNLNGLPVLHHVINSIRASNIDQCIVVTGHEASQVECSLEKFDVDLVKNKEYEDGLSSSIRQACLRWTEIQMAQ